MESMLKIGSRINYNGEFGTVLFVGEIEDIEGTWLGIEWDNVSFGKHSGTYKDKKYFNTSIPNAGSFVKLCKVNIGISCPAAIKGKYGDNTYDCDLIKLPQKKGYALDIEMIGMEKISKRQSNFSHLTEIVVSDMHVNGPGKCDELKELIPNVKDLDLSLNLLTSWEDIAVITEQLSFLQMLILSKNRLVIPAEVDRFQHCFATLKMLVLNGMKYSWKEILTCAGMWPYIEQLCVLDNSISLLEEPPYPIFCKLNFLSLDNNPIGKWEEICKLGRLTNLEELHIDNIMLESIAFPDVPPSEKTDLFPNLKLLFIRNNKLNQWQDISELNKLVKLKELMVSSNPIMFSVTPESARQLVIAKITGLEKLNRSTIERSERRGAELDYIKLHHKEWLASGGRLDFSISRPSEQFLAQHPTYMDLVKKYGVAEDSEVKPQNSLIKHNLISLKIYSPLKPDKAPVIKRLPAQMTIEKLKCLVQRIFKIPYQDIILTCFLDEDESRRVEMDNDLRELSFYSITDKDKIAVEW